jgi:PAS domain S-box-containing protein
LLNNVSQPFYSAPVTIMQKKAMIVDSDFFFVEFLSELLSKRGYQAIKAYDGKEGIGKLEDFTVDILFADLVLPKVDGKQLFNFIRNKNNGNRFPMVALSGIMIENLGSLDEIGADYFIAKGPVDKLTILLNDFMAEMEIQPFFPPAAKKVLATGDIYPRRDAVELFKSLQFHQAVIECTAVGIIIVDKDRRIINANPAAVKIVDRSLADVINCPVSDLFDNSSQAKLMDGLELLMQQNNIEKTSFLTNFDSQEMNSIISSIRLADSAVGWVIVVEPVSPEKRGAEIQKPNP